MHKYTSDAALACPQTCFAITNLHLQIDWFVEHKLLFFSFLSSALSLLFFCLFCPDFPAYPPLSPEVCEVVGACESRHTGRGSCVPHFKPFAQSMLSASIWICVCLCVGVSVCVSVDLCAYICLRVNDQEWFRGMSVGALLALKKLFLCAHMWARPCGCCFVHIQLSQSPTLWSHLYLNWNFLLAYSQKTIFSMNVSCFYLLSARKHQHWGKSRKFHFYFYLLSENHRLGWVFVLLGTLEMCNV